MKLFHQQDLEKVEMIMRENKCSRLVAEYVLQNCTTPYKRSIELVESEIDMLIRETQCSRLEAELVLTNHDDGKLRSILDENSIQLVMKNRKCSRSDNRS